MREHELEGPREIGPTASRRTKTAVIADNGNEVVLVLLKAGQPTSAGACFDHGGRTWMIRGPRRNSRVLVAEPLSEIQQ